jgi:hypothetical protein
MPLVTLQKESRAHTVPLDNVACTIEGDMLGNGNGNDVIGHDSRSQHDERHQWGHEEHDKCGEGMIVEQLLKKRVADKTALL